jgi:hypothetical protein
LATTTFIVAITQQPPIVLKNEFLD